MRRLISLALAIGVLGCGSDSPTAPSAPAPVIPSGPVALSGTVSNSLVSGVRVGGATVTVLDGSDAGRTATTDGGGNFTFQSLARGNANFSATASGYLEARRGMLIDGLTRLDFVLTPVPFTRTGTGASVFDMPTYIRRIRIQGTYGGRCENFVVRIAGRLVVNEILGNCSVAIGRDFDGTFTTTGGVTETLFSNGITWTFTEVR